MEKQKIIDLLEKYHRHFVEYVSGLPDEGFLYSHHGKWTAGQQMDHIVLRLGEGWNFQ